MRHKFVLVPFPFDDLSATKVRVGLCLTERIGPYAHVVVAFITSRIPVDPFDTDIVLDATDSDFSGTGLKVTSAIRLHRLATVSSSVIHQQLGVLPTEKRSIVADKLRGLFEP